MVTVGMNYDVIEGKAGEFEAVFEKVLDVMNGMPGHTVSNLYKNVASPSSYLIVSEWSDEDAFNAFIASEQFRNVANWGKEQILAGRPRHEVYRTQSAAPAKPPASGGCPVHRG